MNTMLVMMSTRQPIKPYKKRVDKLYDNLTNSFVIIKLQMKIQLLVL